MKSTSSTIKSTGFEQAEHIAFQIPSIIENADESPNTSHLAIRRYGFSIGSFHFLAPQGLFCELLVDLDITPLPNAPTHMVGLSNHRGNIIPIYTLAPLLGLTTIKNKYAYLLGQPEDGAALLINDKPALIDLTEAEMLAHGHDKLPTLLNDCVEHSHNTKGNIWHALDHKSLFRKLASVR
ncbi:hypothetical protein TDB9533_02948 [Thalassocella blandensis]|nr:hypothetical protein TDB9533_02948 [Thalassocella blandensis]